jgi:hypothetical protein
MTFSFGHSAQERIVVEVLGYEHALVGEYWHDNRLKAAIDVRAGAFQGKVAATVITSELNDFLSELHVLFETLCGSAAFETIEGQLFLRVSGVGLGHISLDGEVADRAGSGNRLHFALQIDQSQLGASILELERVAAQFPVRA